MRDYYTILGVKPEDSERDIKKAYRRLAMKYHPDHSNGDVWAAEKFKEISEAYAVLTDPIRKAEYNRRRSFEYKNTDWRAKRKGPSFSQEDIFQDLFNRSHQSQFMQELMKEFQRRGMRSDRQFLNQVFFGGRNIFVGATFYQKPPKTRGAQQSRNQVFGNNRSSIEPRSVNDEKSFLTKSWRFLKKNILAPLINDKKELNRGKDLNYKIMVEPLLALQGGKIIIAHPKWPKGKKLSVRIPARTQPGAKLRLKGQGTPGNEKMSSGDLILEITIKH